MLPVIRNPILSSLVFEGTSPYPEICSISTQQRLRWWRYHLVRGTRLPVRVGQRLPCLCVPTCASVLSSHADGINRRRSCVLRPAAEAVSRYLGRSPSSGRPCLVGWDRSSTLASSRSLFAHTTNQPYSRVLTSPRQSGPVPREGTIIVS
jgi:hypothetical protein